jgi:uncharacterized membrane protein YecN with MAPEG domain
VKVTPFYAALFALLFFALSVRTLRLRRKLQIAVGDAGNKQMLRAMRVHGNFAEYVPLTLLLILMLEGTGVSPVWVHAFCIALLAGRLLHAFGVRQIDEQFGYRVFGMAATFVALVGSALLILWRYAAGASS